VQQRLVLQLTHCLARAINLGRNSRTVYPLRLDGCSKSGIVGAKLELKGSAAGRELCLNILDPHELGWIEVEFLVQQFMERARLLRAMIGYAASDQDARECREKGNGGQ